LLMVTTFLARHLPKLRLVGRSIRPRQKTAAIAELEDFLVRSSWTDVSSADVASILATHDLSTNDVATELTQLFCRALRAAVVDRELGDAQRVDLLQMQEAFGLTDRHAALAVFEMARHLYQGSINEPCQTADGCCANSRASQS